MTTDAPTEPKAGLYNPFNIIFRSTPMRVNHLTSNLSSRQIAYVKFRVATFKTGETLNADRRFSWAVVTTPWGMGARPPLLQMDGDGGTYKNSKQETDQTVLTITKALTKKTNCAFGATNWMGTTNKKFSSALRRIGTPHFQIRSGATVPEYIRCSQLDPLRGIVSIRVFV